MSMQDKTVGCEVRVGRFKIGVTATVIDQIPTAGSVEKLLDDVKAHLKANPGRIDYNQIQIGNIGYRLDP